MRLSGRQGGLTPLSPEVWPWQDSPPPPPHVPSSAIWGHLVSLMPALPGTGKRSVSSRCR